MKTVHAIRTLLFGAATGKTNACGDANNIGISLLCLAERIFYLLQNRATSIAEMLAW